MLIQTGRAAWKAKCRMFLSILLLIGPWATALASAQAQRGESLPSVGWVLERYVEATGGQEALLRHESITLRGRYQVPSKKLDLKTITYMKHGKALWRFILPGGKEYVSGYDGKIAWDLDPSGKVTLRKGNVARSVARDADMYYHLHVMKYFRSMKVVGMATFNGRLCYHLRGVNRWGQVNEHFYDESSGLLAGYAFNTSWRGGKGKSTVTFSDYRDFGGVLMPTKSVFREGDDTSISLLTSVSYDDVDDAVFTLPDAVKKAIGRG